MARRAQCMSQLHQICLGFSSYTLDHEGWFLTQPNGSMMTFGGRAGSFTNYRDVDGYGADDRPLNPYTGYSEVSGDSDAELYRCPADNGATGFWSTSKSTYLDTGSSYTYNRRAPAPSFPPTLNPYPVRNKAILATDVMYPAFTVLIAGHPVFNYARDSRTIDRLQRWHAPSKPTANVGFVDGHVAYFPIVYTPTGDTEHYTWYPEGPRP